MGGKKINGATVGSSSGSIWSQTLNSSAHGFGSLWPFDSPWLLILVIYLRNTNQFRIWFSGFSNIACFDLVPFYFIFLSSSSKTILIFHYMIIKPILNKPGLVVRLTLCYVCQIFNFLILDIELFFFFEGKAKMRQIS